MREKELRLALVCFGGVSLAIYMHGICTEILKLVRASAALHGIRDRRSRLTSSYPEASAKSSENFDTESAYFDLLKAIGRKVDMRVVVDIIAGASAGGINGAMLARALCQDLPIDRLSDLWLDKADIGLLLAPEARARRWSKLALQPFLWGASSTGLLGPAANPELRRNMSLFVRSRWFKPPFDGQRMTGFMLDGVAALEAPGNAHSSLIPSGQGLDLFITLTDYHGRPDILQLHDPVLVQENEHRHVVHFKYRRQQNGTIENDFDLRNGPALAFAARATSSFPGAFPPAQIAEVDRVIAARGIPWPARRDFIERCFGSYLQSRVDPVIACFIDGSVMNNRPFKEAIAAIHTRAAYRQVDRRLVYIDPLPDEPGASAIRVVPGFLSTLKAAVSDIPRSQPVSDELNALDVNNRNVRNLRAIFDGARPRIVKLVSSVVREAPTGCLSTNQITNWRQEINTQVKVDAGFAYESYVQLKLRSTIATVANLLVALRGANQRSLMAKGIAAVVEAWAARKRIIGVDSISDVPHDEDVELSASPGWVQFLLSFDIEYRKRRLRFLIEGQNRLYERIDQNEFSNLEPSVVDDLKRDFYSRLDRIVQLQDQNSYSNALRDAAAAFFSVTPSASDARNLQKYGRDFAAAHEAPLDLLLSQLSAEIDLKSTSHELDHMLSRMAPSDWPANARHEVLVNYLGFPYWDVLTLPATSMREAGEFHETLIDRVSPNDAKSLSGFNGVDKLRGTAFGNFAGFFSRAYRENDYLLGRLHAADRLIDIVCDGAGISPISNEVRIAEIKKAAFGAILHAERNRLVVSDNLKSALRRSIMML